MMTGPRTTWKAGKINYKVLGKINPEAARLAVIEYLSPNKGNISEAARVLGIRRTVVYDILKKKKEGDLKDGSRAPGAIIIRKAVILPGSWGSAQRLIRLTLKSSINSISILIRKISRYLR